MHKCLLDGNNLKSIARSCHGTLEKVRWDISCIVIAFPIFWHASHVRMKMSAFRFIPGHHTFLRRRSFILTIPEYPSYAFSRTCFLKDARIMTQESHNKMLSTMQSAKLVDKCRKGFLEHSVIHAKTSTNRFQNFIWLCCIANLLQRDYSWN